MKFLFLTMGVPPMCFLYVAALGWLMPGSWRRTGRILTAFGLLGLWVFSLPIVSELLLVGLERDLPLNPSANAPPAAIVILGGDVTRTADQPFIVPGRLTLERLRTGAALHRRTGLPVLVTGGIVHRDRPPVGTIMADSLRDDFLVPVTWTETVSNDTWENASMSAAILKHQGIASVYVVTNGWHLRRAMIAFRKAGLIATAVPTSIEPPIDPIASDFMPRVGAWEWNYFAMHEWIGCAWYASR